MNVGELLTALLSEQFSASDDVRAIGQNLLIGRGDRLVGRINTTTGILQAGIERGPDADACNITQGEKGLTT